MLLPLQIWPPPTTLGLPRSHRSTLNRRSFVVPLAADELTADLEDLGWQDWGISFIHTLDPETDTRRNFPAVVSRYAFSGHRHGFKSQSVTFVVLGHCPWMKLKCIPVNVLNELPSMPLLLSPGFASLQLYPRLSMSSPPAMEES